MIARLQALRPPIGLSSAPNIARLPGRPLPAPHLAPRLSRLMLCSTSAAAAAAPEPDGNAGPIPAADQGEQQQQQASGVLGWIKAQQQKAVQSKAKLAALGLAAVLAYGLFDGVSYTIAFSIAFLGYEARTGLNPTQNVADLVKICILMWAGNNVTRPFRIAGAAALAPAMDKLMDRLQEKLRLPSKFFSFLLVVAVVAGTCLSIVGALFLSRWARG